MQQFTQKEKEMVWIRVIFRLLWHYIHGIIILAIRTTLKITKHPMQITKVSLTGIFATSKIKAYFKILKLLNSD